jgi:hypothetical protein
MRDARYVIRAGNTPAEIIVDGVVTNVGPATVYYSTSNTVTPLIFDDCLPAGEMVALDGVQCFTTDGPRTTLNVARHG